MINWYIQKYIMQFSAKIIQGILPGWLHYNKHSLIIRVQVRIFCYAFCSIRSVYCCIRYHFPKLGIEILFKTTNTILVLCALCWFFLKIVRLVLAVIDAPAKTIRFAHVCYHCLSLSGTHNIYGHVHIIRYKLH